jgi:hypothetical protein
LLIIWRDVLAAARNGELQYVPPQLTPDIAVFFNDHVHYILEDFSHPPKRKDAATGV